MQNDNRLFVSCKTDMQLFKSSVKTWYFFAHESTHVKNFHFLLKSIRIYTKESFQGA